MEFFIKNTWNGDAIKSHDPVRLALSASADGKYLVVEVDAPLFNDPGIPNVPAGKPCAQLWDYEELQFLLGSTSILIPLITKDAHGFVFSLYCGNRKLVNSGFVFIVVEVFFLGEDMKYLEVELCPHGQHLVLMLKGTRNMFKDQLELQFVSKKAGGKWSGEAKIPVEYLPPNVMSMNAYAIHGSGEAREYEALYHATKDFEQPDFHRLQFFKPLDLKSLFPNLLDNYTQSPHWC